MKKIISFLIPLLVIPIINIYAAEQLADPIFDERDWKLSSNKTSHDGSITHQYILASEEKENWTEAVTVQFLNGVNKYMDLEVYENTTKVRLKGVCSDIEWESIRTEEKDRMWSWSIQDCSGQRDQSEIARAVMTDDGVHVWRYSIRQSPVPLLNKRVWIDNLKSFKVKKKS